MEEPLLHTTKRTRYQKFFGPLTEGSIRGSIFIAISSVMGAGALAIPRLFALYGIITTTIILMTAGCVDVITHYLLINAVEVTKTNSLIGLVESVGGKPAKIFYYFFASIQCLLTCATFLMM